jgi:DNA-binding LacI/PurR family transcriptional regulator
MSDHAPLSRRVTISDIARHAGVSKGAVSYALNNRPGVSDDTRRRIQQIADELGWHPNSAARALSVARAHACGLVLARPARTLALEPFFMELIAGIESELSASSIALTIQLVDSLESEVAVYRRWWAERRVDGVLVVDLRVEDPRVHALGEIDLPAVVVGGPPADRALPAVWHDEASSVVEAVRYLAALGHRRVARVAGLPEFMHSVGRTEAFRRVARSLSLSSRVVSTDFLPESGARATWRLLSESRPPTAIIYDSDVLAATGLGVAQQMGFSVPDDVSIVAGEDSLLSQVVHPPLTSVTRDVPGYGVAAARRLLAAIDGERRGDVEVPPAQLTVRGSTGPPPTAARGGHAQRSRPGRRASARLDT